MSQRPSSSPSHSIQHLISILSVPHRPLAGLLPTAAPQLLPLLHSLQPLLPHLPSSLPPLSRLRPILSNSAGSPAALRLLQSACLDLAKSLSSLSNDVPENVREELDILMRQLMGLSFEKEGFRVDVEELVVCVKSGDEDELGVVVFEIAELLDEGLLGVEEGGRLVGVLVSRLGGCEDGDVRLKILFLLRSLALNSAENKERMAGIEALSTIVRCLSRDADESREAAGLLLDLSDNLRVRQRIGRIQGCILMLVALLNGDDSGASQDAAKLLGILACNTQNVLLMAEAGYFMPMVKYLKEGSDMNKILMATAISRMELTDQMRATLGQEGSIKPLVKMFTSGKLEAKFSALGALRNLATLKENIPYLIDSGAVGPLVQVLFSVTSVLMTLREPAAAILASLAQSELILNNGNAALQMLSLLNLSNPAIQLYLLQALNSIASHSAANKIRAKMKENGAMQLLLPFLTESNTEIKTVALNLLFNLSKDFSAELTEHLGETHLNILVKIISMSTSEHEKAAALGILSNIPANDKKATEILMKANLLPSLISLLGTSITGYSTPVRQWLIESIAGIIVRFTVPGDKKLQKLSISYGITGWLLRLLADGSPIAKARAAISLTQLSQNSIAPLTNKSSLWSCVPPSPDTFCVVHKGACLVKNSFCIIKAGALSPLLQVLGGKEHEADEAALEALATLVQDDTWESGSIAIEKASGVQAILKSLETGSVKAQEKALWILERIFRLESHREKYGKVAQVVLIDLAQKGNRSLKPMIAKILAHLEVLQRQSSYF